MQKGLNTSLKTEDGSSKPIVLQKVSLSRALRPIAAFGSFQNLQISFDTCFEPQVLTSKSLKHPLVLKGVLKHDFIFWKQAKVVDCYHQVSTKLFVLPLSKLWVLDGGKHAKNPSITFCVPCLDIGNMKNLAF